MAHQVTRWYGGFTVVHQVERSCQGAALGGAPGLTATRLRHVCGRWHGWMVCQVARCDGGSVARSPDYVSTWRHEGTVNRLHADVVVIR